MSKTTEELVEELCKLTAKDLSDLKKALEEKWDVTAAAAPVAFAAAPAAGGGEAAAVEEPTDFEVILKEFPADKKIGIIKIVREITGLGLKEAKEVVEGCPKTLKDKSPKAEAEEIMKKLEEAGAKVELKGI